MVFQCSKCGACCKVLPALVAPYLADENGVCKNLDDNKCLIYESRPNICRHGKNKPANMTEKEHDEISMTFCKKLKDLSNAGH